MCVDCYHVKIPDGKHVYIRRSLRDLSRWEVWLGDMLICRDFAGPRDAAVGAYSRDFSDEDAIEAFRYIRVPFDLDSWTEGEPELSASKSKYDPPRNCPPRSWRDSVSGRFR